MKIIVTTQELQVGDVWNNLEIIRIDPPSRPYTLYEVWLSNGRLTYPQKGSEWMVERGVERI